MKPATLLFWPERENQLETQSFQQKSQPAEGGSSTGTPQQLMERTRQPIGLMSVGCKRNTRGRHQTWIWWSKKWCSHSHFEGNWWMLGKCPSRKSIWHIPSFLNMNRHVSSLVLIVMDLRSAYVTQFWIQYFPTCVCIAIDVSTSKA